MRKEYEDCMKCGEAMDITHTTEDWFDVAEEETIGITECEHCGHKHSVSWTHGSVIFCVSEPTEEDLKH